MARCVQDWHERINGRAKHATARKSLAGDPSTMTTQQLPRYGHWINGADVRSDAGEYLRSARPGSELPVCEIAVGNAVDVHLAVRAAAAAFPAWRDRKPIERGRVLSDIAARIRADADRLGALEAAEAGKIPDQANWEMEGAAAYFEFYAGLVNLPAGELIDLGAAFHSYARREPFGVIGVITPWNGPLLQAARAIAPALASGNVVVCKPSEFTSATTLELARIARDAGAPSGVLNVVTGVGAETGRALVEHPGIRKIAFTGSVRAGREIGKIAGERLIPVSLELGGKSPNIVFADADFDAAVAGSIKAFTTLAGQICSSGTRLLVAEEIHDKFVEALKVSLKEVIPGESYGSITTEDQFDKVLSYFDIAAEDGATLAVGGRATGENWLIEPTVYTGVTNDMRVAREEIFGPVLVVIPFPGDEDSAVTLANDSEFGLAAGIWTRDITRAHRVAAKLEAGQVYVNGWQAGMLEGPFGGFKNSGFGREKGVEALHHYTQTKFVVITL
jgi:aldehyde dehydrogenase (NAD+)